MVQALGTMSVLTIPALAPAVARALQVDTSLIGYQVAVVYFAAMISSLLAGALVARSGPCRTSQVSMVLNAIGCTLASVPHLATIILGSLVIGSAYGLINPAASELLMRHGPPARRNLIFSIKQTGVPLGGMAAGLIGPRVALGIGWNAVLWGVAAACIAVAVASQPSRAALDRHRIKAAEINPLSFDSLRIVAHTPALRWLALSSFCFSAVQLCLIAFLVVLLVEEVGLDLVTAGAILAAVQVFGAIGRVLWGSVADYVRNGLAVLFGLALLMAGAAAFVALLAGNLGPIWINLAFLVLGLSAVGWNGVYLSEVARLSPRGTVSAVTGSAMFFTFTGVVFGPALFSILHGILGSYTKSYGLLVALSLVGGLLVAAVRRSERSAKEAVSAP